MTKQENTKRIASELFSIMVKDAYNKGYGSMIVTKVNAKDLHAKLAV